MSIKTSLSSTPDNRRSRRTPDQVKQLERQIYEVLANDHPQSVRHAFYRMTNPRLPETVEKSERGYAQVQDRITKMRRAGLLPYEWITDATRRGYHVETFSTPAEFIREVTGMYRRNLWNQADCYLEVWTESRSIAGIIEDDCEELAVSLYPAGGFSSVTIAYESARYIKRATRDGAVPAEIIYIGDYDPAGVRRQGLQLLNLVLMNERRLSCGNECPL